MIAGHIWKVLTAITLQPCRAEFIFGNLKIFLHFLSFLSAEMVQVLETHPQGRQGPYCVYIVNTMVADDLATQEAKASVTMVLTLFFADDIFRCNFVNEKFCILIKISLKFVPKGPIDNNPALVEIMAWRPLGDKPLSEPMLTRFTDPCMQH